MISRCFDMDHTTCIMRMQPVETGIIAGNTHVLWNLYWLTIDIHTQMSMYMESILLLLITVDAIYRRIVSICNCFCLTLSIDIERVSSDNRSEEHTSELQSPCNL